MKKVKEKKERGFEPLAAVWILLFSFLGLCALVGIGITALVINFNL